MSDVGAVISIALVFLLCGWNMSFIVRGITRIERYGVAFLLGSGTTTLVWFLLSLLHVPLTMFTFLLASFIIFMCGLFVRKIGKSTVLDIPFTLTDKKDTVLALVICGVIGAAFVMGSYHPLTAWDSLALYDFRGHVIAIDHSLTYFESSSYYVSYPLFVSMVHAAVYFLGASSAQGIHALIFAAFLTIVFGRLREWSNTRWALLGTLVVAVHNDLFSHATIAYSNLPYVAFLVAGLFYIISPIDREKQSGSQLILGGLLVGLSTWVRSAEVFWAIGILGIAWQGWKLKKLREGGIGIFLTVAIREIWMLYHQYVLSHIPKIAESLGPHLSIETVKLAVSNIPKIASYLYRYIYFPYQGIWFVALAILLAYPKIRNSRISLVLATIILAVAIVIGGVTVFSTYYTTWYEIGDSAMRMMMFVIPMACCGGIAALYQFSKKKYGK